MAEGTSNVPTWSPVAPTILAFNLAVSLLVASSPSILWRLGGTIACLALCLSPFLNAGAGDHQSEYSIGCMLLIQASTAIYLLCLSHPLRDFRYERDTVAPSQMSFLRRWYWALCVMNNPRAVGWTCQVANVPAPSSEPRWSFVRRRLKSALYWYIALDIVQCYQRRNPMFSRPGTLWPTVSSQGYLLKPVNVFSRAVGVAGGIALGYFLLSAAMVAIGFSLPRDWPDIYGKWSDSYTIRRFWGRTYHQMLRRLTSSAGKAVCQMLGLQTGSWASSYTQLYVGFALSGLIHCGGDMMVNYNLVGSSLPFFIYQALAITAEDAVIGAARMMQLRVPERLAHFAGYVWVIFWMNLSIPSYVDWSLQAGIVDVNRVPFSVLNLALTHPDVAVAAFFYGVFYSTRSFK